MNVQKATVPISVGVEEAARLIGIARSMLYEMIARGDIASFKVGRRRLILMSVLEAHVRALAEENGR